MITLYYLGRLAEDLFGSKAFLALYLLSGMMGNVFVAIFTPDVIAAGASTALFGLFGTIGALRFIVQSPYIRHLSQSYTSLIVVNLIFSFMPGISMAGHIGGLVAGVMLAYVFPVRGEARFMNRTYQMSAAPVSYTHLTSYKELLEKYGDAVNLTVSSSDDSDEIELVMDFQKKNGDYVDLTFIRQENGDFLLSSKDSY